MSNVKHVLPTRRILQITKLCSFKVTWILSFCDSVLMDDVCEIRCSFGRGEEVSLEVQCIEETF